MKEEKKHCKWYKEEICTNGDSTCVADYCPVVEYPELCKHREIEEYELCDEDIAKAFEVCNTVGMSCNDCPFDENGEECSVIEQLTVDLLKRLQSENEAQRKIIEYHDSLQDEVAMLKEERENMQAVIFALEEEKRELKKENAKVISFNDTLYREKQQAVKDTAEKFAERLNEKDCSIPIKDDFIIILRKDIYEICKELTEDK